MCPVTPEVVRSVRLGTKAYKRDQIPWGSEKYSRKPVLFENGYFSLYFLDPQGIWSLW